jgi:hypothetical protein
MRMHGAGILPLRRRSGAFVEEASELVRLPADLVANAVAGCPTPS